MFQYWIVLTLLVIEIVFLTLLLIPLPEALLNLTLKALQYAKVPIRVTFVILAFFTFGNNQFLILLTSSDQTMEMRREEAKSLPQIASLDKENFHKTQKFRAERFGLDHLLNDLNNFCNLLDINENI